MTTDTLLRRNRATFSAVPSAGLDEIPSHVVACVIGAGHSLGSPHPGAENGPYFLRTLSKHFTWAAKEPSVFDLHKGRVPLERAVDLGDVITGGSSLEEALRAVRAVVKSLPEAVVPCVIGGDHTVTLPVVEALAQRRSAPFTVVQFDHHLDLQIWAGAPGRPDAARERIFHTNVMSHVSDTLGPGRLVQIGLAPHATVEAVSVAAMDGFLRSIGRQIGLLSPELEDSVAFQQAVGHGDDVYLTVDVDVLDHTAMSSTGYPAAIGLGVRELLRLIDLTLTHNRLIGFDVVEFGAPRGARDATTLADGSRAALIFQHLLSWACRQGVEGVHHA
jgi:agmatinase/guanidinopropionase